MKFDMVGGIAIPKDEQYLRAHLAETPGYAEAYDRELIEFAWHTPLRTAIDVGASFGLWSRKLARHFQRVVAFEPVERFRDCFAMNVTAANVEMWPCALGDRNGAISMIESPGVNFKTRVSGVPGTVVMRTLDSFAFIDVDFIKIDCEGFDFFVLQGGLDTIARCRPVIVFESKPTVSLKRYGVPQLGPALLLSDLNYDVSFETRGNTVAIPKEKKQ